MKTPGVCRVVPWRAACLWLRSSFHLQQALPRFLAPAARAMLMATLVATTTVSAAGPPAGQPIPAAAPSPFVFRGYTLVYNASARPPFRLIPERFASGTQPSPEGQAEGIDQISLRALDPVNNALRINATLSPGGSHTPTNADQVFTSASDSVTRCASIACLAAAAPSRLRVTSGDPLPVRPSSDWKGARLLPSLPRPTRFLLGTASPGRPRLRPPAPGPVPAPRTSS
jgi:hypothetical protein